LSRTDSDNDSRRKGKALPAAFLLVGQYGYSEAADGDGNAAAVPDREEIRKAYSERVGTIFSGARRPLSRGR
jgi:hypothetical protein